MSPTQYNTGSRKQPLRGIEATIWAVGIILLLAFLGWAFFGGDPPTPERPGPRTPIAGGPSASSGAGVGEPTPGDGDEDLAARTMKLLARSGEGTDPATSPLTPVPAPPPAPLDPPAPAPPVATAPSSTPLVEPGSEPTPVEPPLPPPPAAPEPPVSALPGAAGLTAVAGSEPSETEPAASSSTVTPPAPAPTPRLTATGTERPGADLVSTYQIEEGDTLSDLALRFYGSAQQWRQIAKANPDLNPDRLKVGQTIRLPDPEAIAAAETPRAATPPAETAEAAAEELDETTMPDGRRHVRVKAGDSLSSLAGRYLGNSGRWAVIYAANRHLINDPDDLTVGMKLIIPTPSAPARPTERP